MRKLYALILAAIFVLTPVFYGCGDDVDQNQTPGNEQNGESQNENNENGGNTPAPTHPTVRVGSLKGPTSMGLVSLMEKNDQKTSDLSYEFTIEGTADALVPKLVKGELDMVSIPANLASVVYNNTDGKVQVVSVNTLGVLYVVERGNAIQSFADLRGKTVYATGKGTTPEHSLRYLLTQNGLDPDKDLTIEWKTEAQEVVAQLAANENGIAMLPQPYVTVASGSVANLRIALSLNDGWVEKTGDGMVTGVMVVRKAFAEEHPETLAAAMAEYAASAAFATEQVDETANLVEKYGIVKAAVAKKAIPHCNITWKVGADMKSALEKYLNVLFGANPASVGGALPKADFYYGA